MANDIPDSKILEIEYFMDSKKKEIVDFIERKTKRNLFLNTRFLTKS